MKFFLLALIVFFVLQVQMAQAQESGVLSTNSPSIKWYQINTTNFKILYPKGFEFQAQRMANTLEHIHAPEAATLGVRPKKIAVVLQNQTAVSNGFVAFSPRRSEFYTMPAQDNQFTGNNDWLNLLATHEYRHIVQFQNSITGFNKLAYYLFGQQFLSGLAFAAAPNWFWEGDAVATETAFTHSGRGRIPNFDLLFRTNLLEGRNFNYHKQYLRSYKHNIPNHYVLGYEMVSFLRKKTGNPTIWEDVTHDAWSLPFVPFTFSSSIKKQSGLYVVKLYNEMAADLRKQWTNELSLLTLSPFEKVMKTRPTSYTDYKYPQPLEDGSILVQKSGIGDIVQLVRIKDGKELKGFVQGQVNDAGMLSAANQRVVWNEYRYDPRWPIKSYSIIKGFDFGDDRATVVSKKSKYNASALSPDGYKVATIETDSAYNTRLLLVDYFSGKTIKKFPNPGNDFISMPHFTPDGLFVVALKTTPKGKCMVKFNIEYGNQTEITPISDENLGYPVPFKNYIFYNSPYSGIDNIYALDLETGKKYQVTCAKYGAYYPAISIDGKSIYYNEQTRDGLDVVKIPFDPSTWIPLEKVIVASKGNYQHLVEQEGRPTLLDSIPTVHFETKRYHRASGMINPHSWGPYFVNSLNDLQIGISSQDVLSTTQINAGYQYDFNERVGAWKATASYQGFFPIIDVTVSYADRKLNEGDLTVERYVGKRPNYTLASRETQNLTLTWKEKNVAVGLRVPFNLTTSKFISSLTIANYVGATQVSQFANTINNARIIPTEYVNDSIRGVRYFSDQLTNGSLWYNHFSLTATRLLKQSRRDIFSRWGQAFYLNTYHTPYGGDYSGNLFSFYGLGLFPGLFKHHSIWGYWGMQTARIDNLSANRNATVVIENYNYQFKNQLPLPRGGLGISRFSTFYSMSGNYTLPVWYPDFSVGPLLNIQRIRANGFFDYGFGKGTLNSPSNTRTYMSTGIEMRADINVMRFLPQFNVGFRYSVGIQPSTSLFELLIGNINF